MFNRDKFITDFWDLVCKRMTYQQIVVRLKQYGVEINKNTPTYWLRGHTKLKADQFMAICDMMNKNPNEYYEKQNNVGATVSVCAPRKRTDQSVLAS